MLAWASEGLEVETHEGDGGHPPGGDEVQEPGTLGLEIGQEGALDPAGPFQEVKAWMALLLYLGMPPDRGGHFPDGRITAEYASSADFRQFPTFGAAVRVRNAAYSLDRFRALAAAEEALEEAP